MLADTKDAFGVPFARLDWRVTDLERRTMEAFVRAVDAEFARLNLAGVQRDEWLTNSGSEWTRRLSDTFHHIGTTRMASSPKAGVVDADCRVHGVANLFVAGSSVFPTSGYANPTLTILALAIRLADHLKTTVLR
ncbi:MAG: hypothetical protein HY660_02515 [Armatimonadetes bacterium]|nr:hypothetical protein [Armatimonadota bacterium]